MFPPSLSFASRLLPAITIGDLYSRGRSVRGMKRWKKPHLLHPHVAQEIWKYRPALLVVTGLGLVTLPYLWRLFPPAHQSQTQSLIFESPLLGKKSKEFALIWEQDEITPRNRDAHVVQLALFNLIVEVITLNVLCACNLSRKCALFKHIPSPRPLR